MLYYSIEIAFNNQFVTNSGLIFKPTNQYTKALLIDSIKRTNMA